MNLWDHKMNYIDIPRSMDLPEPVSPVMAVKPCWKSISNASMSTKFLTVSLRNI